MFLFLDPGGTTGHARFDGKGNVKGYGQISGVDNVTDFLTITHSETPLEEIYYEPYILDNDKIFRDKNGKQRRSGLSPNEKKGHQDTLQVIGAVKSFSRIFKVPAKEIRYVSLKAALAQTGLVMPKNHDESHEIVALAYGGSLFIQRGIIKPSRLRHT